MADVVSLRRETGEREAGEPGATPDRGILRITLNNPPANLLSLEVMRDMQAELDRARDDDAVRVVVIAAAGKLFCAGHDLKQMTAHRTDPDGGKAFFEETFAVCSKLMQSIVSHPKPVIAEIDGIATAAGCQLVASCDLAVAAEEARFATPGGRGGWFCTTPMVAVARAVEGACAQWGVACAPASKCMFDAKDGYHRTCEDLSNGACKRFGALCAP